MTYYEADEVVPELRIRMRESGDGEKGDYLILGQNGDEEDPAPPRTWRGCMWHWFKLLLLFTCLGLLAGVCLKWVWPFLMEKEIIPIISWETSTFSPPVLAVVVFTSIALFPTFLLPSSPSMWVAGMTFGYGYGFLLIISGMAIGVSLPYFIGSLFHHKLQIWFKKYPKKASLIRSAGAGNCVHQLRAVALIRISPFPYILYNYCAVATNVKYVPYILGSLIGVLPEIFIAIYTGILIKELADASYDRRSLSALQILLNVIGFLATVATTVIVTMYAKKQLKLLRSEEEEPETEPFLD